MKLWFQQIRSCTSRTGSYETRVRIGSVTMSAHLYNVNTNTRGEDAASPRPYDAADPTSNVYSCCSSSTKLQSRHGFSRLWLKEDGQTCRTSKSRITSLTLSKCGAEVTPLSITVAVRWWVRIPLEAWMYLRFSALCCPV
jgi:hypothetical protein